jgi:hypothetical protein
MDYTNLTDRELDRLVAEKVIGGDNSIGNTHPDGSPCDCMPCYSSDIGAAWEIIALCQSYKIGNPSNEGNTFAILQMNGKSALMLADTAPRAICLAALLVTEKA